MITLAFYKGRGTTWLQRLQSWAIRFSTGGIYSHVELIEGAARLGDVAVCLSSSGRDGGVRSKSIFLNPAHWDLVHLRINPVPPAQFIREKVGAPYDYLGILLSQILAMNSHDQSRWFCSEICGAAIGIPDAQRLSPQLLYDIVTWGKQPK